MQWTWHTDILLWTLYYSTNILIGSSSICFQNSMNTLWHDCNHFIEILANVDLTASGNYCWIFDALLRCKSPILLHPEGVLFESIQKNTEILDIFMKLLTWLSQSSTVWTVHINQVGSMNSYLLAPNLYVSEEIKFYQIRMHFFRL